MQKDSIQRGFPTPDEAALGTTVSTKRYAPDLATVKDFLRIYVAASRGKIVK